MTARRQFIFLCLLAGAAWFPALPAVAAKSADRIDFNRDIRPIFSENCYACHGPDQNKRKAGLRLDQKEEAFKQLKSGNFAIVSGDAAQSTLVKRITSIDPEEHMPPPESGKQLNAAQIDLLRRWVRQGADWKTHWSYLAPERPTVPDVKNRTWPRNEIDRFVLARLEKDGLAPSPEADQTALARRTSFDLTGLPPTIEEVDAFLGDKSSGAYEKFVDRLLGSRHFGERLAVNWMDLARYADTSGYHFDSPRFMWLWRDWVIKAFNQNLPFDRFTIEQLAGDQLPESTLEQKIASGFHRNVMTNDEGGADPDEYLAKYVVDRVSTTATVWLGTTLACAECHDHKYDPILQKEFYRLYAFFHSVPEKGLDGTRTENPKPRINVPTPEQASLLAGQVMADSEAEKGFKAKEAELPSAQAKWEKELLAKPPQPFEPAGLLAVLNLEEAADGMDAHGARLEGNFKGTNAPVWVEGKAGRALKLSGQDVYLELGRLVQFERTNAFSLGAWAKVQKEGGALISKMEDGPGYRGFDLLVEDGKLAAHLVHAWPSNALKVASKEAVPKDTWLHLLVTYDGTSKAEGVKLYVNGKSVAVESKSDKLSETIAAPSPVHIGRRLNSLPFHGVLDDVRFYDRALPPAEAKDLAANANLAIVQVPADKRTGDQQAELKKFFRENAATEFILADQAFAQARKNRDDLLAKIPNTMVMEEMEKPRETFILVRGNFQNKGEKIEAGVPSFLPPLPEGSPASRLTLARWLVSPQHPLTSRVTVNRYWQMVFGTGLVKSVNDFGSQGEWPSHPELLDWLATEFMASKWDLKHMLKLMVTSATYRQSSVVAPKALARDPYNRLLTRGPRQRLDAEFIRDNALAISGLLNPKIGGESVRPYQPPGMWEVTDRKYEQSHGPDLYRRGLYVYWKRAVHYPSFATFDAPNREVCAAQRPRTSTPLQSLVLMNDPVYVEAARALAQRVINQGGPSLDQRITYAFRLALARLPTQKERRILEQAYVEQRVNFDQDQKAAEALVSVGESPKPKEAEVVELAAWTAVGNVLLNLNETISK